MGAKALVTINRITRPMVLSVPLPTPPPLLIALALALAVLASRRSAIVALAIGSSSAVGAACLAAGLSAAPLVALASAALFALVASRDELQSMLSLLSVIALAVCLVATARYLLYFAVPSRPFSDPSWAVAELHLKVIHSLQLLSLA